jgi:hypothetical protein
MGGLKLKRLGMIMAPEPGTRMNWKGSSILTHLLQFGHVECS